MLANNKTSKILKHFFIGTLLEQHAQTKPHFKHIKCGRNYCYFFASRGKPVSKSSPLSTRSPA